MGGSGSQSQPPMVQSQQKQQLQGREIQCRECEGYGHIQVQCPNYIKKQTRSYYSTHSDEDTDEDEGNNSNTFVAFTAKIHQEESETECHYQSGSPSDDDGELTEEELIANCQMLFRKWTKLTQNCTSLETEKNELIVQNINLVKKIKEQKAEISFLGEKIQKMSRGIKMMNSSTDILDEILEKGKKDVFRSGIGHTENARKTRFIKWIPSKDTPNQQPGEWRRRGSWKCYHCGKLVT
ncbi:hypothetical protein LIER_16719 [Lithospermum erythrorhizon]|uniref:Gag-protease polyprotein n=1 Tax=Lithospermum erythrorhizon TaxID=34254 RepID=A0AAV3Q7Q2_LITER